MKADSALQTPNSQRHNSQGSLSWDDAGRTLTIGPRAGAFEGLLANRTFTVVVVSPEKPIGYGSAAAGKTIAYRGDEVRVTF